MQILKKNFSGVSGAHVGMKKGCYVLGFPSSGAYIGMKTKRDATSKNSALIEETV
jgi:hypothetical protein